MKLDLRRFDLLSKILLPSAIKQGGVTDVKRVSTVKGKIIL